jgi:LmbE family N-acetylglucosaminyl deacetylase
MGSSGALAKHCDCLFLSPHLDDAVLSCALRILKERGEGKTVAVATLFSKGWQILEGFDLHRARRFEDVAALTLLGVENPIWLGYRDAPFRNLFYSSFQRVIMGEHAADRAFVDQVSKRVARLYEELAPGTIFLPLAVGTHIDHRLTHQLWCTMPAEANIVFYEDRPYSFLPYSLKIRFREIGAAILEPEEAETWTVDRLLGLESFAGGLKTVTMYKNVLTSKRQRFRYILDAARKLKSQPRKPALPIRVDLVKTNDSDTFIKVQAAVSSYKSQIPMLFKNMDTFKSESASYNRTLDPTSLYCERYWNLIR